MLRTVATLRRAKHLYVTAPVTQISDLGPHSLLGPFSVSYTLQSNLPSTFLEPLMYVAHLSNLECIAMQPPHWPSCDCRYPRPRLGSLSASLPPFPSSFLSLKQFCYFRSVKDQEFRQLSLLPVCLKEACLSGTIRSHRPGPVSSKFAGLRDLTPIDR